MMIKKCKSNKEEKLKYFEYMIYKFKEWYEENGRLDFVDTMSRVKAQKLLFLCAAIKNPYGEDLLNMFDSFYAMKNGFVDADVHQAMVDDSLVNLRFKDRTFSFKNSYFTSSLDDYTRGKIDIAIGCLKAVSPKLVYYQAIDLSEIHKGWTCWKACDMTAEMLDKQSEKAPTDLIRISSPIFRWNICERNL